MDPNIYGDFQICISVPLISKICFRWKGTVIQERDEVHFRGVFMFLFNIYNGAYSKNN